VKYGDLTINLGWKGFATINKASPVVAGGRASGRISAIDWFQPTVGASYKLGGNGELYAGFAQSTRAYQSATTSGPFSASQAGFDAVKGSLKPESSTRMRLAIVTPTRINATLGAYLTNFHNRLLVIPTAAGIVGSANLLSNVGGVRSAGIEALINARLGHGFSTTLSYAYNDSTYRNDIGTYRIAGKTTVDAPST
jgi:iron complex outermembrane receptor protein